MTERKPAANEPPSQSHATVVEQLAALAVGLLLVIPAEWVRFEDVANSPAGALGWLFDWNIDSTIPFLVFLTLPFVWRYRSPNRRHAAISAANADIHLGRGTSCAWAVSGAIAIGLVSLVMSYRVAQQPVSGQTIEQFGALPPAYHDEYSYLFQAKTFLAGRTWYPSVPDVAACFDQMHVLNEGRMASRYFPTTGGWIAPFLALGLPHVGHWLAGAIAAALLVLAGREIGGLAAGLVAGLLLALSPGAAIFSNLLLAHHPTLLGLSVFLFAFLRMMKSPSRSSALCAGCGLTFAMLARPMTAAGFALPFGLWLLAFVCWGTRDGNSRQPPMPSTLPDRLRLLVCVGAPIAAGLAGMSAYNTSITGHALTMPYQQYTDIYTPRHIYGFHNVSRGAGVDAPKRIESYDEWAEELTPKLAMRNVFFRFIASGQWTFGLIPVVMAVVAFMCAARFLPWAGRLVLAALVSIHAAHVPYWFTGIMNWHYVFESAPLLALIGGIVAVRLSNRWRHDRRPLMPIWLGVLFASAMLPNLIAASPLWPASRLHSEVGNLTFARQRYQRFHELVETRVTQRPAIVIVEPDRSDLHVDFVVNDPGLTADILFARPALGDSTGSQLQKAFPDRTLYRFHPDHTGTWPTAPIGSIRQVAVAPAVGNVVVHPPSP